MYITNKIKSNKKEYFTIFLAIIINAILFLYALSKGTSYYITNDDYRLRLISSGAYTGDPSYQLVFIKAFIGYVLQFLYEINQTIQWYDFYTLLCMYLPTTYLLYTLIKQKKVIIKLINFFIYFLFYIFILYKHIMLPQFTIISAFCGLGAVCSLINLLEANNFKKKYVTIFLFCVFNLLCFGIRDEIFFMVLVMEVFILIVNVLIDKSILKFVFKLSACIIFLCLTVQVVDIITLSNSDYIEFKNYTKSRSLIYDYYPAPDYELHKEFYDSIGMNADIVNALQTRTLDVDDSLNTENYNKVAEYSKSINEQTIYLRVRQSLINTFKCLISDNIFPQIALVAFLFALAGINIMKDKNEKDIFYFLGSIGYILFGVFILIFRGRIMDRIIEAIILVIMPILFYIASCKINLKIVIPKEKKKILLTIMCSAIGALYLSGTYYIARDNIYEQINNIKTLSMRLEALQGYAKNHPQNFYFYNALDFIGASDRLFSASLENEKVLNMDSLGNWNSKSPNYYKRNKKYGFTSAIDGLVNCKNVYYVECWDFDSSIEGLINNKYKKQSSLVEQIIADDGTIINIYEIVNLK
ncbi:hypothetical protein MKD00_06325 [[Clostridium] innocuum]|nr:hypothetical protein [[Clostridium] innocuum]MCR0369190.1 hypothetical protein [[Clostridium] innocuum]